MTTVAPSALADARRTLRGQNLIRLEWVARQLVRAAGQEVDAAPVLDLHAALAAAGDAAGPVLVDPRFGSWLGRLVRLIERRAPQIMPAGAFRASCAEAGVFAAAARILESRAGGLTAQHPARGAATRIRIGPGGRTPLPGAGVMIVLPAELAGLTASVFAAGEQDPEVVLADPAGGLLSARLVAEAVPVPGLVVPDGDPVQPAPCWADAVLADGPPVVAVQRGVSDLLAGGVPGLAVVPREADAAVRTAHALAAAAHLAAVLSSPAALPALTCYSTPPPRLNEVCEAGQIYRLLALRTRLQELRVPAVAAVDEVLTSVGEWLAAVPDPGPGASGLLGLLRESGLQPRAPRAAPGGSPARPSWRTDWRRADGRWRVPRPVTRHLTASTGELAAVLAELGCPDGIEVNLLSDQRLRADPSMDHLSLMLVREPARYAALTGRLDSTADCAARRLLLGHRAYLEERFAVASAAYAGLLREYPYDADLWRDLTFALRHLGRPELGQTWLFHPEEVIDRASACHPDATILDHLLPRLVRPVTWSGATPFVIGILEWVGHDHDHG
jgi:hypothetical protein